MKKITISAAVAGLLAVIAARNLPDLRRYLRIRAM
ncbi:DUF6893 family small protein [Streptantibioticus ferralitis]